ncbi:MAG: serine hydrolase domain-containing protein [Actinomycetaceae bacterium]|nr:serine hydrolase domain-containing protein [Actinomycetaceae bacterium]
MLLSKSPGDLLVDHPTHADITAILELFPFAVRAMLLSGLAQTHPVIYHEANRAAQRLNDQENASFRWASVTKVASAFAIHIARQHYMLSLDEPAGPEGSTLRHLLSHASGIDFNSNRVLTQPGLKRIYSNRGIEIAAHVCEEATGESFDSWLENQVIYPLGMTQTFLWASPAWGMKGPIGDLGRFALELMMPTLLDADSDEAMTMPCFPGLSGVVPGYGYQRNNVWAMGPELRGTKDPHWTSPEAPADTFGHFGQSGSFLWVDRRHLLAGVFVSEKPFGRIHKELWLPLNYALFRLGLIAHGRQPGPRPSALAALSHGLQ